LAEGFNSAWRDAHAVDLDEFLPPAGSPLRVSALHRLVKLDLEIRWQRNQPLGLDFYLGRFPELGSLGTVSPQLIYEEYRVRVLFGDKPPLSSYQSRFSAQFPELQRLLAQHPIQDCWATVAPTSSEPVAQEDKSR